MLNLSIESSAKVLTNAEAKIMPLSNISLAFDPLLTRPKLVEKIKQIDNPQVIMWYIGDEGLKEQGAQFYKNNFFSKFAKFQNNPCCWLYDLSAWGSFKDNTRTMDEVNPNVECINDFAIPYIRSFASKDFFSWLRETKDLYIKNTILNRTFIYKASKDMPDKMIKIGQIFSQNCPMLEKLYNEDAAKCYSAMQYLEGIYLIDCLVEKGLNNGSKEINIVFALPNDESKYYGNSMNDMIFKNDVEAILANKLGRKLQDIKINILFCPFTYSSSIKARPYKDGQKIIEVIQRNNLV